MMQEAMEGAGLRGGRRRWAADEEEAAAAVAEKAAAAGVRSLETQAAMVGGLDPPGRRRFQKGFDWRNLWSSSALELRGSDLKAFLCTFATNDNHLCLSLELEILP
ncbi:hypothetical protein H671_3g9134 [Cricetulus griseus]|uniref:Uncharacterized protein n=1 Tax=Cricetulus griseus TaxID=10029 RepID=A0A061IEE6_CRIGR|nr:hypothetical protein H671_3g9134 [Cricetulus griseus]